MKDTDKNGIYFVLMSQRNIYSKELLDLASTKINFMIASEEDVLDPIDVAHAINLIGGGDSLVYNKELFGNDPKPLKAFWIGR